MEKKGLHILLFLIQSLMYFLEILEKTKIYIFQPIFQQFHFFKNTGFSNFLFNVPKYFKNLLSHFFYFYLKSEQNQNLKSLNR